ncbi:hypothetical protein [Bradyrhizobium valentinum]|uniref:hypothetical protein n=1 Tax=Bradyrhizobium valentinum TaxID=1518501 RepID=UPI0009E96A56
MRAIRLERCAASDWNNCARSLESALACKATVLCLNRAGVKPEHVDRIIFVSSSGITTPSLDVDVISKVGLRTNARRTPIFGLGCAGGASGANNLQQSWRFDGEPPKAVLRDIRTIDWILGQLRS